MAVVPELDLPLTGWRREAVEPCEVVCHGDIAPYNAVFRQGRLVAFLDWDYAGPGPRLWDVGYAAYRFVSLTAPTNVDGRVASDHEQWRRVGLLCDAYGGDLDPVEVVVGAGKWLVDHMAFSRDRAAAGDPVFVARIAAGDVDPYEEDLRHVERLLAEPQASAGWGRSSQA